MTLSLFSFASLFSFLSLVDTNLVFGRLFPCCPIPPIGSGTGRLCEQLLCSNCKLKICSYRLDFSKKKEIFIATKNISFSSSLFSSCVATSRYFFVAEQLQRQTDSLGACTVWVDIENVLKKSVDKYLPMIGVLQRVNYKEECMMSKNTSLSQPPLPDN